MKTRIAQIAASVMGLAMIFGGLFRGEAAAVLRRAVIVCLECIGIG